MSPWYIGSGHGEKIKVDVDLSLINAGVKHGIAAKDQIVLHETVSPDYPGPGELVANASYLAKGGLGIHGVIDAEGYLGWSIGDRKAILYHAASNGGNTNTRSVGVELVSRVMIDKPDNVSRWKKWWGRDKQIDKLAQLIAFVAYMEKIPLAYSGGKTPGITTHWSVSKAYSVPGGHVDCWPRHEGGYFPVLRVIREAKAYHDKWYGPAV